MMRRTESPVWFLAEPELGRITRLGEISFGTIPILEGLWGATNLLLPLVPGYSPLAPFSYWVVRTMTAHIATGSPSWLPEGHDGGHRLLNPPQAIQAMTPFAALYSARFGTQPLLSPPCIGTWPDPRQCGHARFSAALTWCASSVNRLTWA